MPSIDVSTSISLLLLAVVFIAFCSLLLSYVCFPFVIKQLEPSLREVYPTLFDEAPLPKGWDYLREYAMFFSPFLFWSVVVCISVPIASKNHWILNAISNSCLIIGIAIEFFCLKHTNKYRSAKHVETLRLVAKYLWLPFFASLLSFLWMLVVLLLVAHRLERTHISDDLAWFLLPVVALLFICVHAALNKLFSNPKQSVRAVLAVAMPITFFAMFVYPGLAYLGSIALRSLNLGGGIPVAIYLKSAQAKPVPGCLILATATEVLVSHPTPGQSCSFEPSALWETPRPQKQSIDNYQRSEVLKTTTSPAEAQTKGS